MSAGRNRGSDQFATAARETTPAQRAAASRLVLRHARNREDLRYLLDVLGLNTQTSKDSSS
ncbi:hypothetical protein [Streptomyces sp. KR55]|uniref:hypothetical protein n=1 Tax=Streptomyces sp. KR55 TaxID=3457425 RepID=UPI003FD15E19